MGKSGKYPKPERFDLPSNRMLHLGGVTIDRAADLGREVIGSVRGGLTESRDLAEDFVAHPLLAVYKIRKNVKMRLNFATRSLVKPLVKSLPDTGYDRD